MWVETIPFTLFTWFFLMLSIYYGLFDVFVVIVFISVIVDYYKYYERCDKWGESPRRFNRFPPLTHAFKRVATFVLCSIYLVCVPLFWLFSSDSFEERLMKVVTRNFHKRWATWCDESSRLLKPNHVVVSTVSKSGTNLGLMLVQSIVDRGTSTFQHIHDVAPWPDQEINAKNWSVNITQVPTDRYVPVKTHNSLRALNADASSAKFIYICRDPKSVVLSMHPFFRAVGMGPFIPDFDTSFELWLAGHSPDGPWADHVHAGWTRRHLPNVLFLRYEEIVREPANAVDKVVSFLGVPPLSSEEKRNVVKQISFPYMKSLADKFAVGGISPFSDGVGNLVRSGKVTADELSPSQRRRADTTMVKRLAQIGSDFPYKKFYQ